MESGSSLILVEALLFYSDVLNYNPVSDAYPIDRDFGSKARIAMRRFLGEDIDEKKNEQRQLRSVLTIAAVALQAISLEKSGDAAQKIAKECLLKIGDLREHVG